MGSKSIDPEVAKLMMSGKPEDIQRAVQIIEANRARKFTPTGVGALGGGAAYGGGK